MGSAKGSAWTNLLAVTISRSLRPFQGRGRLVIVTGFAILAPILAAYFAWRKWGPEFTNHERFRLRAEALEVTPQPAWIHADVKAEVFRDGSLQELKILDEQVAVKVASAFALHNWVANVKRVSKHPGPKIVVDLEYRKPVAMVEVTKSGTRGLLPVDLFGVLLPTEDFSPNQTRNYLRIAAGDTPPAGLVGTAWGDERIAGAARLAALLEPSWRSLGLYRIAVSTQPELPGRRSQWVYELQARKGACVIWGGPPGHEGRGEPSASEKLVRLEQYVQENGPLDAAGTAQKIDLREALPPAKAGTGKAAGATQKPAAKASGYRAGAVGRRPVPVPP